MSITQSLLLAASEQTYRDPSSAVYLNDEAAVNLKTMRSSD
jgi:hypothetical protein